MELRHLRYFVTVAEELHFGRAARRLHIAGPPLSQQIRKFERELGFPLFERSTRNVTLTRGGEALLARARELLKAADDAVAEAARHHEGKAGSLFVGFAGSLTYELLPRVARIYRNRYPAVELTLTAEMVSRAQLDAIRERRLDVGFLRPFAVVPDVVTETVLTEPLVAMLPAQHRLAGAAEIDPAQLRDESFVLYERYSFLSDTVESVCSAAGFVPRVAQRARESYTVACLVAAGYGVALVPAAARTLALPELVYVPLTSEGGHSVPLAVAWRKDDRNPTLHNFLDVLHEIVGRTPEH